MRIRRIVTAGMVVGASLLGTALASANGSSGSHLVSPALAAAPKYNLVGTARPDVTTFSCQLTTPAGCYGPAQIRAAYGVDTLLNGGLNGAGRTIVIIDAFQSPTIQQDLATFDAVFGLPNPTLNIVAPDGLTPFDQGSAMQTSWAGEITLDTEWAHAIAPAATIDLVLAKSSDDSDILSATKYAVDNNLGDVISQSFGEAESCVVPTVLQQEHALFQQATNEGMTLFASSGDLGAAQPTCDNKSLFLSASSPASDPLVTAVGGTILDANGLTGAYNGETVWNEPNFGAAGGGGFSTSYSRPGFQATVKSIPNTTRGVPDVAYNAAIIGGVLVVWSSSGQGANLVFRFGGTSAGSPQWAGITALADQSAGRRLGWINPTLYQIGHNPGRYGSALNDVTTGNNTLGGIGTYSAGSGWDAASGLGTPKANTLVPLLVQLN
jgi:subtilase family serine protease